MEPQTKLCRKCGEILNKKGECRNGCEQFTAQPMGDTYCAQQKGSSYSPYIPNSGLRRNPTNRDE